MKYVSKILFHFLFWLVPFLQAQTADFFVAENPAQFEILNQYKQKLTPSQKQNLIQNTPWQIVEESTLLSDNYSKAMHVKFEGQSYFFMRDQEGNLISASVLPKFEIFKHCNLLDETFIVIMENAVLFREVPFSANIPGYQKGYLQTGTKIINIFRKGTSFFIKDVTLNRFGWVRIENPDAFRSDVKDKLKIGSAFIEILKEQLNQKVDNINSIYSKLYTHLNAKYAQQKPAPYWEIVSSVNEIQLNLINVSPEKMKKSRAYFFNNLQNMIIGQAVEISSNQSQITLTMKSDE